MSDMLMPDRRDFGQYFEGCIGQAIYEWNENHKLDGSRMVMGYNLPEWQRPFVWTEAQSIRLIESIWLGLSIGTYTFNRSGDDPNYDNLLIDGQQRLKSIESYLLNKFPVFGHKWGDLCRAEQIRFERCHFHSFITSSRDDEYLRGYYDMMNFGGTAHDESQRAADGQIRTPDQIRTAPQQ